MLIWMLVPVARCSFRAFRDAPIGAVDNQSPGQADKQRLVEGTGFFTRVGRGAKVCYLRTPLSSHGWKTALLCVLAGATLVFWGIDRVQRRRSRPMT